MELCGLISESQNQTMSGDAGTIKQPESVSD